MEPLLTVTHLTKEFARSGGGPVRAVDDISFTVHPGEAVGIVGASGSGKSTIAKLVTALMPVTSGTILFQGQDMTKLRGSALRKAYHHLQMVFQTPVTTFDPRRTLGDGIGESLVNQGLSRDAVAQRVEALLLQCGLEPSFARAYPLAVSGGQCQRASIARALAADPQLLICDEATSSLDVTLQAQIMTLLRQLKEKQHMAFLFITHNIALAQQFCDTLLVMEQGRIVEQGRTDDVISQPQHPYTQELLAAVL